MIFISGLVQPEGGEQGLPPPVGLFLSAEQKAGSEEPEEAHRKRLQGNKFSLFAHCCTVGYWVLYLFIQEILFKSCKLRESLRWCRKSTNIQLRLSAKLYAQKIRAILLPSSPVLHRSPLLYSRLQRLLLFLRKWRDRTQMDAKLNSKTHIPYIKYVFRFFTFSRARLA